MTFPHGMTHCRERDHTIKVISFSAVFGDVDQSAGVMSLKMTAVWVRIPPSLLVDLISQKKRNNIQNVDSFGARPNEVTHFVRSVSCR